MSLFAPNTDSESARASFLMKTNQILFDKFRNPFDITRI
jgi:hypothetical protein